MAVTRFNQEDFNKFLAYQEFMEQQDQAEEPQSPSRIKTCAVKAFSMLKNTPASLVKSIWPNTSKLLGVGQAAALGGAVYYGKESFNDHGLNCVLLTTANGLFSDFDRRYNAYFKSKSWSDMCSKEYLQSVVQGFGRIAKRGAQTSYKTVSNNIASMFPSGNATSTLPVTNGTDTSYSFLRSVYNTVSDGTSYAYNNLKDFATDPTGYPKKHILEPFMNSECAKASLGVQIAAGCVAAYLVITAIRFCINVCESTPSSQEKEDLNNDSINLQELDAESNFLEENVSIADNEATLCNQEVEALINALERRRIARGVQ